MLERNKYLLAASQVDDEGLLPRRRRGQADQAHLEDVRHQQRRGDRLQAAERCFEKKLSFLQKFSSS